MTKLARALLVSMLACLCSMSVSAQMQGGGGGTPEINPCLEFLPDNTIEWPTGEGYGSSDFRRMVVAELNGDDSPDAVVNANGTAVVLWDIIAYDAPQPMLFEGDPAPTAVTDLAVLPGAGPGGTDGVLISDWRGLYLVTYDGTAFEASDPIATGDWVNAAAIHVDDVDHNGPMDIFGISADRKKILLLRFTTSGMVPTTVQQTYVLRDVVAVDWNGMAPRELVAVSDFRGLRVYTIAGTALTGINNSYSAGCITRLESGGVDYLAWTRKKSTGSSELVVRGSSSSSGPWDLTFDLCEWTVGITPTALAAGDYDGDGAQDLLLAHEDNQTAVMLIGQAAAPFFDPSTSSRHKVMPLSAGSAQLPGNIGIPVFAQLDGEGVNDLTNPLDLAFPVSASSRVEVFLSRGEIQDPLVTTTGPPPTAADVFHFQTEFHPGDEEASNGELALAFVRLPRYDDYTHIYVAVWKQEAPGEDLLPVGSYTKHLLLSSTLATHQYIEIPYGVLGGSCWESNGPCYYVELRFMKQNGSLTQLSRQFTGGFRLDRCGSQPEDNYSYLLTMGIPDKDFLLWIEHGLDGGMGTETVGIFVPMSSQPPFEDGFPPLPDQPNGGADTKAFNASE